MITDSDIKDFVDTKPWEQLLFYRIIEFLKLHWLYCDIDAEKQDFGKQVIDWWNRMSEWQRTSIFPKLSSKVEKVLKENWYI